MTYTEKMYPILFWILAINPVFFSFVPKDPAGRQPYLYIPLATALIVLIIPAILDILSGALRVFPLWVKLIWWALILWSPVIIFHNLQLSIECFRYVFGTSFGSGTWLAPLVMVAGANLPFWKRIIPQFKLHTLIGLFLAILFAISLIPGFKIVTLGGIFPKSIIPKYKIIDCDSASSFLYAAGFLFLCLPLPSTRNRIIAFLGLFFMMVYKGFLLARRNVIFKNFNYIFFFFCHWMLKIKERFVFQKFLTIYLGVIFFVLSGWLLIHGNVPSVLKEPTIHFQEKLFRNTRKGLFQAFYNDIRRSKFDMLIGKGSWGRWGFMGKGHKGRLHIENGYAYLLLKGGIIYLVLFLVLTIPSAVLGIRSNNWFVRGCGLFVFCRLLDMFPFGLPIFDGNYLIFWLCVGCCLNSRLRKSKELTVVYER